MAKKLDLSKIRAGQTVYLLDNSPGLIKREWPAFQVIQAIVDNSSIPPLGVDPFWNGKVSRFFLKEAVAQSVLNRRGGGIIFISRNKAQKAVNLANKKFKRY